VTSRIVVFEAIHAEGLERLRTRADVDVRLGCSREEQLRIVADAAAIVVRSVTQVDGELLDRAPRLRVVGRAGSGTENIDLDRARERGVEVVTVPGGNAQSVAEFTILQMLALCRKAFPIAAAVRGGDFRREQYQGVELAALRVAVVGVGRIGQLVVRCLRPFGCRVVGFDVVAEPRSALRDVPVIWAETLDDALRGADIVTVHVPRTPATLGLIGARELRLLNPGAFVVNTSRGGIIHEDALVDAIRRGHVGGAAIDVLVDEPPFDAMPGEVPYRNALLDCPGVYVTPHCAASTEQAQRRIAVSLADEVIRRLAEPRAVTVG
jgi:D-3-phosphoglycerate dehydrogenase